MTKFNVIKMYVASLSLTKSIFRHNSIISNHRVRLSAFKSEPCKFLAWYDQTDNEIMPIATFSKRQK